MADGDGVFDRFAVVSGAYKLRKGRGKMDTQELQRLLSLLSKFRSQEYGMSDSGESVSLDAVVEEVERAIKDIIIEARIARNP